MALLLCASTASSQVVVNEVLYDPEGPDTGREFVELLNCGRVGVALGGWTLETGNGANPDDWTVEWIGDAFDYLEPGQFMVIGEDDVLPEPDHVTALDLQNGPDAVRITDGDSVVDLVGWGEPLFSEYYEGAPAVDVESGSSLARVPDCYDHDDNSADMAAAPVPTPGSRNSPELDLCITALHPGAVVFDPEEPQVLHFRLRNVGSLGIHAASARVSIFLDGSDEPLLTSTVADSIAPRDTTSVMVACRATDGYHQLAALVSAPGDCEPENDRALTSFAVGAPGGLLRLNEVMFSPLEGSTEWVEFRNVTSGPVDVSGWLLGDEREWSVLACGAGASVGPGEFLVVARDSAALGSVACRVLETESWEALSADDTVLLLDAFETPIERVTYTDDWGGERGVSLERVRTDVPADAATNWGSSVARDGSTPCGDNSIFLPVSPTGGLLAASPNPFTPDSDGSGDRTVISFELPVARATVRLTVFDARGRERATLIDHSATSSRHELIWDGTDSAGALLPSGMYVVRLEAISPREGVLVDEKLALGLIR